MNTLSDDSNAADKRTVVVKVRLNAAEALELDRRIKATGGYTRSRYLRETALKNQQDDDLAALIGRIGLTFNQLDQNPARGLGQIARQLDEIIFLMRERDR